MRTIILKRIEDFSFRFFLYGCTGMALEIIFTNMVKIFSRLPFFHFSGNLINTMQFPPGIPNPMNFPDKYLYGTSSVWMFIVYAVGFMIIEQIYTRFFQSTKIPLFLRFMSYTFAVFIIEFLFGWLFRYLLGDFIWRYDSFMVTTSFSTLPVWFFGCFFAEVLIKRMILTKTMVSTEKKDAGLYEEKGIFITEKNPAE